MSVSLLKAKRKLLLSTKAPDILVEVRFCHFTFQLKNIYTQKYLLLFPIPQLNMAMHPSRLHVGFMALSSPGAALFGPLAGIQDDSSTPKDCGLGNTCIHGCES